MSWTVGEPGVVELPSGRLVRGRGLGRGRGRGRGRGLDAPLPPGPLPQFGVHLLGRRPAPVAWEERWVRWPDFRLPADPPQLRRVLGEVLARAGDERVELACRGGTGRTGTALACLAVLDGVAPSDAVAWVRTRYRRRAVETPAQRRFVAGFGID